MGIIRIDRLEVFAHHGFYEEEQRLGQRFLVSLLLDVDFAESAAGDDLEATVSYGTAARFAADELRRVNYRLLESAAAHLAEALLLHFERIRSVSVRLEKPGAPIGLSFQSVGVELTLAWHTAYLGLGSNLGERSAFLDLAEERLKGAYGIRLEAVSSRRETEPWGYTDQPSFLNSCARIRTFLSPEALLDTVLQIEREAGRERSLRWGPRTLDIDILLYDDLICGTERLVLPHPEMERRQFVLDPMCELAPWLRHPVSHKTMRQLAEEAGRAGKS